MRIAIRADATTSIGLGHIKRCLSLAHALRESGAEVALVVAYLDIDVSSLVLQAQFKYVQIPHCSKSLEMSEAKSLAWSVSEIKQDAFATIEVLKEWMPEFVIVDHYNLDADWHQLVSQQLNTRIAVIDDLADRKIAAQFVIDHNFSKDHRAKYKGLIPSSTELLGGPRFALLGQSYVNAEPYKFREHVHSIGIFMGGTDPSNMSTMVLKACRAYAKFQGPIEIATTSSNPHYAALKKACAVWPDTTLLVDESELSGFFARHDLQIGAGGGATWERCCMGAPTLAIICADNQRVVVPALHDLGVLATINPASEETIGQTVRRLVESPNLRRQLSNASKQLVDGHGSKRVALVILRSMLKVRPADTADMEAMFNWRNHPITRGTAHNNKEISWETHKDWFLRSLDNSERHLLIAEIGNYAVGVIRFDLCNYDVKLSIYIDPDLHALGLGKRMLCAGEKSALIHWPKLQTFIAEVMEQNIGSQRLFISAGYEKVGSQLFRKSLDVNIC